MRIGIDATCWANDRGYGRFTREIVTALVRQAGDHEFVCFLDRRSASRFALSLPNVRAVVVETKPAAMAASTGSRRAVRDMLQLTRAVRSARLDVFYSPSVYGYFPLPPGLPAAVSVLDAIAERFPELTLPTWRDRWAWRAKVRLALTQARVVLTLSDYAAGQVSAYLGVARSRLRVTLAGVAGAYRPSDSPADVAAAATAVGLPRDARWLMYVGGFGPHKRVDSILRAHAAVVARRPEAAPHLVLAGSPDDGFHTEASSLHAFTRDNGTEPLVHWTGYLPDDIVRHLHSGAVATLLVSASEGFGLPAVEAARCGTPVIATVESPLPRLLEGGGIFVSPGDAPGITNAIERLLGDEAARRAMGRRALARAGELSWERSARVVLEALEDAGAMAARVGAQWIWQ